MERHRWVETFGDNLWAFLALVFIITWACGLAGYFLARAGVMPFMLFQALGVIFGVVFPPVILTRTIGGRNEWRDYWHRVFDFKRIPGRFYALIVLFFPVISGLAMLTGLATGEAVPAFRTACRLLSNPVRLLAFAGFTLLFGPFPEELCWRGYVLDRIRLRHSTLKAGILLGIVWALWHLPLFFVSGTFQHDIVGVGTPMFWMFHISIVAETVIMTWIYYSTNRSTLSAILFHFFSNFYGEFLDLPAQMRLYRGGWTVVAAVIVTLWMVAEMQKPKAVPGGVA